MCRFMYIVSFIPSCDTHFDTYLQSYTIIIYACQSNKKFLKANDYVLQA